MQNMLPFPYSLTCPSFMNIRTTSPSDSPSPPAYESSFPQPQCFKTTSAVRLFPTGVRKSTAFTIEAILGLDNCMVQQQVHRSTTPGERTYRTPYGLTTQTDRFETLTTSSLSPDSTHKERSKVARNRSQSDSCLETHTTVSNCSSKSKRVRTIFTPEQLEKLEREFERQQYMVGPERLYLASALNLTEAQVKVWFQNRRIKWRKQHLELQQARLAKLRRDSCSDFDADDGGIDHVMDQETADSSSPGI